jgi:hypothetical protein
VIASHISWNSQLPGDLVTPLGKIRPVAAIKVLSGERTPLQQEVVKSYFQAFENRPLVFLADPVAAHLLGRTVKPSEKPLVLPATWFLAVQLLLLVAGFLVVWRNRALRRRYTWLTVALTGAFLLYALFYLLAYLLVFGAFEARSLTQFERYLGVFIAAQLLALIVVLTHICTCRSFRVRMAWIVAVFVIAISLVLLCDYTVLTAFLGRNQEQSGRASFIKAAGSTRKFLKDSGKVYVVAQATSGFPYWIMRYELAPLRTNRWFPNYGEESWSVGTPYFPEDIWTSNIAPGDWAKRLRSFDALLIVQSDPQFWQRYGSLFINGADTTPKVGLFAIDRKATETVSLRPAS